MGGFSNPMTKKLDKAIKDKTYSDTQSCTYSGIFIKTLWFLVMVGIGIAGMFAIFSFNKDLIIPIAIASIPATLVFGLLAGFIQSATPVFGTLYNISEGLMLGGLMLMLPEYQQYSIMAVALTMIVVLTMLVLYVAKIIKVTEKFKSVMFILLISSILFSLFCLVASFIPGLNVFMAWIAQNLWLTIAIDVIFIVFAALFLLVDFDTIEKSVSQKLPKKYEWVCSFGLALTILWIYLRILDLLSDINK